MPDHATTRIAVLQGRKEIAAYEEALEKRREVSLRRLKKQAGDVSNSTVLPEVGKKMIFVFMSAARGS